MNSIIDCPTCVKEPQNNPVVQAGPDAAIDEVTANEPQQEEEEKEEVDPESK